VSKKQHFATFLFPASQTQKHVGPIHSKTVYFSLPNRLHLRFKQNANATSLPNVLYNVIAKNKEEEK
jgi:hypothetical protein